MPDFEPVRTGRPGPLGSLRGAGPRVVAVCLAVAAVAAMAWGPPGESGGDHASPTARSAAGRTDAPPPAPPPPSPLRERSSPPREDAVTVEAPVRIPDAAVVRLLRPGDRVDVLATAPADEHSADTRTGRARIVARNVRVAAVPGPDGEAGSPDGAHGEEAGALVVFSVPRPTALRLAGAAAHSRLAVTLC
ncbi:RcpC/CpaB family pilus assembly protein [Streptomyces macrosporus]|uniref:RcpC/CpaB family pilus assembly protein n=1 Tax=Streptomyces macrosporus TaxID=44032 RepID=UPI0031D94B0C